MRGFHIDMNVAQFRRDYLERWLRELAGLGYDTVLWEVEDCIAWETCPECASPDAFSREEFRGLLALCRELGLEPVPLLQTIAHCEYVLKHEEYAHLAEIPGELSQYCPRNPELVPFLHRWIEEYLELFGDVRRFHIGADEAWWLGRCEECSDYVERHSAATLYVEHVNAVIDPLLERGIAPIVWADMVLHHHEGLDALAPEVMLFDWAYNIHRGDGRVQVWGTGLRHGDDIPPAALDTFGPFLFPRGDEPGRDPETFYTADFLAHRGFETVTCPASSSYGDNVFVPRHWYHLANTFDSFRKGSSAHLAGSLLTSWTVHLFPWELQLACIDVVPFQRERPGGTIEDFQAWFAERRFGLDDPRALFRACGLLSKSCLFTHTASLGFNKSKLRVPLEHARERVAELEAADRVSGELNNCADRLQEYRRALSMFRGLAEEAERGRDLLELWILAARNLVNRAEASALLLERAQESGEDLPVTEEERAHAAGVLCEMRELKQETRHLYDTIHRPTRRDEAVTWMFDSVEHALAELVGDG